MDPTPWTQLAPQFAGLSDPRVERTRVHRLGDLVTIALCAILCGANDWVAVETFGRTKEAWLHTFLALPGGIPSHDTFGRVFARLNPTEFQRCFVAWVQALLAEGCGQVVAVDGKTLRRSADRAHGREAVHLNQSADETYIGPVGCSAQRRGVGGRRQDDWQQRVARTLGLGCAPGARADVPRSHGTGA
jgi:hypothetical protein